MGLGILIDSEGRIKLGNFQNNELENYGVIVEKKYRYEGFFKKN